MELTEKDYWLKTHTRFELPSKEDDIYKWLLKNVESGNGKCIEIGCMPGRYIYVFGKLGYTLNGIDYIEGVDDWLPSHLKKLGFNVGKFEKADFVQWKSDSKYDIVCSFGFIEHFANYRFVMEKMIDMVDDNGLYIMTVPNFKGSIKRIFHKVFDRKCYKRHNMEALDPEEWEKVLKTHNFQIIRCEYFGNHPFWVTITANKIKRNLALLLLKILNYTFGKVVGRGKKNFSAHIGIIARKTNNENTF